MTMTADSFEYMMDNADDIEILKIACHRHSDCLDDSTYTVTYKDMTTDEPLLTEGV